MHQVGTSRHFHIWCTVTHTSNFNNYACVRKRENFTCNLAVNFKIGNREIKKGTIQSNSVSSTANSCGFKNVIVIATISLNFLKPSGFFTYHQVWHSKILHGVHFALRILYGSQNRQRLFLYTSFTDWFRCILHQNQSVNDV